MEFLALQPDIFTCISIYGRPYYTAKTLNSLYSSSSAERIFLNVFFSEHPDLTQTEFMSMMQAYPNYRFHFCRVNGGNYAARYAFSTMLNEQLRLPDYWSWYLFIENDIEFDKNWLEKALILKDVATPELCSRLKRLGFISLNNFNLPFYNSTYVNSNALPFYIKDWTSSQAYLITPELLDYIDLNEQVWRGSIGWDRNICSILTRQGFAHIVPATSLVIHKAPVSGLPGLESC